MKHQVEQLNEALDRAEFAEAQLNKIEGLAERWLAEARDTTLTADEAELVLEAARELLAILNGN